MRKTALVLLVLAWMPGVALADEAPTVEKPAPEAALSPFGLKLMLEQGLGLQTDADTTSASLMLQVAPSYRIDEDMSLTLSLAGYVEQTAVPADGKRADFNAAATYLRFAHGKLYEDTEFTGLKLSGTATLLLPLARDDVYNPRYPTPSAGLTISRTFAGFKASYGLSYTHYLPTDANTKIDFVDYGDGASERPETYRAYGWNGLNLFSHTFGLGYTALEEKLSLSVSGTISNLNTRGPSETSVDRTGTLLAQSANDRDLFGFVLGAGWAFDKTFSIAGGLSNLGAQRPNGGPLGGSGSDAVNGGVAALFFSEQTAQVYLDFVVSL